jgi:hypothetical protein
VLVVWPLTIVYGLYELRTRVKCSLANIGIAPSKGWGIRTQSKNVVKDENLSISMRAGPDADRGDSDFTGYVTRKFTRDTFDDGRDLALRSHVLELCAHPFGDSSVA